VALIDDDVDDGIGIGVGVEEVEREGEVAFGAEPEAEFVVGVVVEVPAAEDAAAVTDLDDDVPSARTANHLFSTPWPRACPSFVSLTNV
jgi:hypothetical protein